MNPETILARVKQEGTPLIEAEHAMFVWQGKRPPLLMGDFTNWEWGEPVTLEAIAPDLWTYRLPLPYDAYMEYAFIQGEKRIVDPYNKRKTPNGVGKINHLFYMPGGSPNPFTRRPHTIRGKITKHMISAPFLVSGHKRLVYLYQPPVEEACPLLVVYDGRDYLRRAHLAVMVERMVEAGEIAPLAIAFVQHGGGARVIEYSASDSTLRFIQGVVLPYAQQYLNLLDIEQNPGAYGVLGASMGGLMALYTGLRLPGIFGRVLSQSGAFSMPGAESVVYDLVECMPTQPIDLWMDVGLFDFTPLLSGNRRMIELLRKKEYAVTYREYPGGHNYPSWRDDVRFGLSRLFPASQNR